MPYLNWTKASIRPVNATHPTLTTQLTLGLNVDQWGELLERVRPILSGEEQGELRVDFPAGWTVFWKRRESESRLLLAHPERDAWVCTVALSPEHSDALIAAFATGGRIAIGELGPLTGMSNFEMVLQRSN